MSNTDLSKESRVLRAVKLAVTNVIKDTATQPGLKHPLSEATMEDLRQCLVLISGREREIAEEAGDSMVMRPSYVDEPAPTGKAEVSLASLQKKGTPDS